MAVCDQQTDERGGQNLREKGEERTKGTKMNILYERFWSVNIPIVKQMSEEVGILERRQRKGKRSF